jgi:hypothetical protein
MSQIKVSHLETDNRFDLRNLDQAESDLDRMAAIIYSAGRSSQKNIVKIKPML